ncbi:MAG: FAD-dependent oxidoreductase, partial [Clostridiales bacterium]|nr:FAD-dependent oxidoreductase [Clostridiales bacterium]
MSCALRAAQSGVSVIVLEQSGSWSGRGGNIGVANSSYMKSKGYENDVDKLGEEWIKRCGNRCDERIVRKYLLNGGRAMDWLTDIITRPEYGARPALQGSLYRGERYREYVGSHRFFDGPMAKKGARAGGADAVFAMYSEAVKAGVEFRFGTRAVQLVKTDGAVTGVVAQTERGEYEQYNCRKGCVLATGDIGGNEEMCEDLAPIANKCAVKMYSPKNGNLGDGHRMGLWAGGVFEEPPFPTMIHSMAYTLCSYCFFFAGTDGRRFMNEDTYAQGSTIAMIREGLPYAWSILDSDWPEKVERSLAYGGGLFWGQDHILDEEPVFDKERDLRLIKRGEKSGTVVSADTPGELAKLMGVPVDAFCGELARYNRFCEAGRDEDFGKRPELLMPIDKPPYYALKFGPALLAVVGGLRTNAAFQVLGEQGGPIPGLYAVGNVAGGRYGVDYPLIICGSSHGTALTFGFLLGEELAEMQP